MIKLAIRYYSLTIGQFLLAFLFLSPDSVSAQFRIKGTVYDETGFIPLVAVSVLCSSGNGAITDSAGHYSLIATEKDSIWFSYLGKETQKFVVSEIPDPGNLNISLRVNVQILKEVKINSPDYRLDSIQNRIDYAKVFNYQKPSFKSVVEAISITGVVINLDELIRVFQYRKKRMMLGFQNRLLKEEQEKFISYRFTKRLVTEITGLSGELLDSFMVRYRPTYQFIAEASDYTLRKYIRDVYEVYKSELLQSHKSES